MSCVVYEIKGDIGVENRDFFHLFLHNKPLRENGSEYIRAVFFSQPSHPWPS